MALTAIFGSGGGGGPAGATVWLGTLTTSAGVAKPSGVLATSGRVYAPMDDGDRLDWDFVSPGGVIAFDVLGAMSAADPGTVSLRLSHAIATEAADPDAAKTALATDAVTPGNDVLAHVLTHATLVLPLTVAGDHVLCRLERIAGGTHPATLRVFGVRPR